MYNNKLSFISLCTLEKCFSFCGSLCSNLVPRVSHLTIPGRPWEGGCLYTQLLLIFELFTVVICFSAVFIKRQNCLESNFSYVLKLLVINFESYCGSFTKSMLLTDNQRDTLFLFSLVCNIYMYIG